MSTSTTVAFPVVGSAIPDFPPLGDTDWTPEEFRQLVERDAPHWLFHLLVEPLPAGFRTRCFTSLNDQELESLHRHLGLPDGGVSLRPREFIHGDLNRLVDRSPYAFGLRATIAGRSALLAVAAGLTAAALDRPLPEWVLFSGPLETPIRESLALGSTGDLQPKVLLAFGRDRGYAVSPVLERLYRTDTTATYLGEHSTRVCPERIRLFITSGNVDAYPLEFDRPLSAESIDCRLDDFREEDFPALREQIRSLVGDDLLLVQVPTVFHALRLLGYHRLHPLIEQRSTTTQEVRFFRVRHASGALEPRPEFEAQMERALLETMLARARDCRHRLRILLKRCMGLLHCQSGDIGVLRGEEWLEIFCREHPGGPENGFVPALLGITGRVVSTRKRAIVPDTAADDDFQQARGPHPHPEAIYREEVIARYRQFLESIRACVKLPLLHEGRLLGVLCLHRDVSGPFNLNVVDLLEVHATRAAAEVARFLDEEQAVGGKAASEMLQLVDVWLRWLSLPDGPSSEDGLVEIGNALVRVLPSGAAWLWLLSREHTFARCLAAWHADPTEVIEPAGATVLAELGEHPFLVAAHPDNPALRSLAEALPQPQRSRILSRARVALPLSRRGTIAALFFLAPRSAEGLTEDGLEILRRVTGVLGHGNRLLSAEALPAAGPA
jgi:hypothetical protein